MKKYLFDILTLLALVLVTVGCTSAYPTENYDLYPNKVTPTKNTETANLDREPINVFVNGQDYSAFSTRGVGVVDVVEDSSTVNYINKLTKATFFVYAFAASSNDYSRYRFASTNAGGAVKDTVSCLMDGTEYYHGLAMRVDELFNHLTGDNVIRDDGYIISYSGDNTVIKNSLFFHGTPNTADGRRGNKFFCYYVDDIDLNLSSPQREKDRIYYKNLQIDGTQDIRCGTAPKITDELINSNLSAADKNIIIQNGYYSAYAASRGVFPHLPMGHEMVCMKFFAVPGKESAAGIVIKKISLHSRYQGEFTVAAVDTKKHPLGIKWNSEIKPLVLHDASVDGKQNCAQMTPDTLKWKREYADSVWYARKISSRDTLGGSLLVAPDYKDNSGSYVGYTLEMEYEFVNTSTGKLETATMTRQLKFGTNDTKDCFQKGYKYEVNIGVFGPEDIQTFIEIKDWDEGGDIPVNPDDI